MNPVMANQVELRWVMAMSGSTPTLQCSCCGTRLWVKLHTSAESKAIRIAVPTVLGELRCGHITSVSLGWAGVSCFGIVSGSCAVCYDGWGVR